MSFSAMLKVLANGVHPDTGEVLAPGSVAHRPDVIRMLFAVADELTLEPEKQKKSKLTVEERQLKNRAEGRPANAYFPWTEAEKLLLEQGYQGDETVEALSEKFERSTRAVAIQLEKMGLITAEQFLAMTQ
ncbi:MAG TPA: hypothetical protein VH187_11045 [Scandinavium sp.]|uniref:hypothetical protein n=1 Tax=Scandinavium sp. TaxID=2830653 RepID=UPI002E37392F|nr:hypothetical protein [Scandinavium sp.]HEX4501672.1 hypothetical protein [Scandinavium sp.]